MVVMLLSAAAALVSTVSPPASNSTHVIDPALLDRAFDGHARKTWILAMDVISAIAQVAEWNDVVPAARHNALALRAGRKGSDIPFFRIWAERQLAAVGEMILAVRSGREMPLQ